MFSSVSPFCDKCKATEDTTARAFWFCPSRSGFWTSIFDWYSKAYNRPLLLDAELAIFSFSQHTSSLPNALQQALTLGMIVAKRLILKNWKSSSPPSFWLWTMDIISVIQMERLWFLQTNDIEKCSAVWGSFLGYLDKQAAKPMSNVSYEGWVVHYLCAFLKIVCFAALYYGILQLLNLYLLFYVFFSFLRIVFFNVFISILFPLFCECMWSLRMFVCSVFTLKNTITKKREKRVDTNPLPPILWATVHTHTQS